jgi:hypothetical protein
VEETANLVELPGIAIPLESDEFFNSISNKKVLLLTPGDKR